MKHFTGQEIASRSKLFDAIFEWRTAGKDGPFGPLYWAIESSMDNYR